MKIKRCDKCGKVESHNEEDIKRMAVMIQFPYYDYFGFDLCDKCLGRFQTLVKGWLG